MYTFYSKNHHHSTVVQKLVLGPNLTPHRSPAGLRFSFEVSSLLIVVLRYTHSVVFGILTAHKNI